MDKPSQPEASLAPLPAAGPPTPLSWRLAIAAGVVLAAALAWVLRSWIGPRGQAAAGVVCFIGLVAALSANLRAVNWRTVGVGFALQLCLALFILRFEVFGQRPGYRAFEVMGRAVARFLDFTSAGTGVVFGVLADREKMGKVFGEENRTIFAFTGLPTIIFVSSFFAVLYFLGILQLIVKVLAKVMMGLMGTSGAETLSASANVFMGQTEAPLIVKPYIARMTQSELLALMAGGMATISGGMMAIYIGLGADAVAILATSVMAAPCALYLSKLLLPETGTPLTRGQVRVHVEQPHRNVIDAAAAGASDGLHLALNVAAMLIAFMALVMFVNFLLGVVHPALSLERIFGLVFWPVAMLLGVEAGDIPKVAELLGIKLATNEFLAFIELSKETDLGPRSRTLVTFALTGFANFASVGILLGGVGVMAPERRPDLARLGLRALFVGFTATLVNAALVGILL